MAATSNHSAPSSTSARRKPCRFCQRSRWALTLVSLALLASVVFLNLSGARL